MRIAIISLGLLAAFGTARAGEEKINVRDLPPGVLAAVKAKFPEGKVTGAAREDEDGKVTYEVVLTDHDAQIDVGVSAAGKILEVEKTIAPAKLPEAVAVAIEAKYPKAKITKAEEVIKYKEGGEEKSFEVVVSVAGKDGIELKLSPKGKILEDDGDKDEDEEKKTGKN
jgi:hypothetical protein